MMQGGKIVGIVRGYGDSTEAQLTVALGSARCVTRVDEAGDPIPVGAGVCWSGGRVRVETASGPEKVYRQVGYTKAHPDDPDPRAQPDEHPQAI